MSRRGVVVAGIAVLIVAAIAALIVWAATSGTAPAEPSDPTGSTTAPTDEPGQPDTSPTTQPGGGAAGPAPVTPDEAQSVVDELLDQFSEADPATDPNLESLEDVATGAILDELRNEQQELDDNGWTRRGAAVVDGIEVVRVRGQKNMPTAVVVEACIDSSAVRILDANGDPIGTPTQPRALTRYTIEPDGRRWKVAERAFPDDPSC